MDADELKEEIAHQKVLIQDYSKRLRVLEKQSASFGSYTPPYIQVEIDETNRVIRSYKEKIDTTKKSLASPLDEQIKQINFELTPVRKFIDDIKEQIKYIEGQIESVKELQLFINIAQHNRRFGRRKRVYERCVSELRSELEYWERVFYLMRKKIRLLEHEISKIQEL
jgi:hypothetical protein